MRFEATPLQGSFIVYLTPFQDERGWFSRVYCDSEFTTIGHFKPWKQVNHSVTFAKGSIRGMHYQIPPFQEIKLVRCIVGAIFDVIIDLRKDSQTFGTWFGTELTAQNRKSLYIPEGFAHGFQTLEDNCELIYHHSEMYSPGAEAGIRYNDAQIGIKWPLTVTTISKKDNEYFLIDSNFKGITNEM